MKPTHPTGPRGVLRTLAALGMRPFDAVFKFLEAGSKRTPAEQCYLDGIKLVESDGRLVFSTAEPFRWQFRFIFWFRWAFLAVCLLLARSVYKDLAGADSVVITVFKWLFVCGVTGLGLMGAFVIGPVFQSIMLRIKKWDGGMDAKLPSFDLARQVVTLPDRSAECAFSNALGFKSTTGGNGWNRLHLETRDASLLFMFNYPPRDAERVRAMLEKVAAVTGIRVLEGHF